MFDLTRSNVNSWTGLIVLSKSSVGFKALVSALKMNQFDRQTILLDILVVRENLQIH